MSKTAEQISALEDRIQALQDQLDSTGAALWVAINRAADWRAELRRDLENQIHHVEDVLQRGQESRR